MKQRILAVERLLGIAMVAIAVQGPTNANELVRWNLSDNADGNSGFGINNQDASIASATITNGPGMGVFSVGTDSWSGPVQVLKTGPGSSISNATAADALANNWYFDVALTPTSSMDIRSIQVDWSRGGTTADRGWFVRSSADSYASDLYSVFSPAGTATGLNPVGFDITGFTGLASPTTFRFYSYTNATFRYVTYQNLRFNSHSLTSAVPEPGEWAAMGILGAGLVGLVIRKRRKA